MVGPPSPVLLAEAAKIVRNHDLQPGSQPDRLQAALAGPLRLRLRRPVTSTLDFMWQYLPELLPHIEAEWQSHIADDFLRLSEIPSGAVAATAEIFRRNTSKYDVTFLMRYVKSEISVEERAILWNEYLTVVNEGRYRYKPIAEWKPGFKYKMDNGEWSPEEMKRLKEFWRQLSQVDTPKATDVRKALKPILSREFGTKLTSQKGGIWVAPMSVNGLPLSLVFDFGGFSKGFRYELWLPLKLEQSLRARLSYESALGFNTSPWDLVRTDHLSEQLELSVFLLKKVLGWLSSVDWRAKELDNP